MLLFLISWLYRWFNKEFSTYFVKNVLRFYFFHTLENCWIIQSYDRKINMLNECAKLILSILKFDSCSSMTFILRMIQCDNSESYRLERDFVRYENWIIVKKWVKTHNIFMFNIIKYHVHTSKLHKHWKCIRNNSI